MAADEPGATRAPHVGGRGGQAARDLRAAHRGPAGNPVDVDRRVHRHYEPARPYFSKPLRLLGNLMLIQ